MVHPLLMEQSMRTKFSGWYRLPLLNKDSCGQVGKISKIFNGLQWVPSCFYMLIKDLLTKLSKRRFGQLCWIVDVTSNDGAMSYWILKLNGEENGGN